MGFRFLNRSNALFEDGFLLIQKEIFMQRGKNEKDDVDVLRLAFTRFSRNGNCPAGSPNNPLRYCCCGLLFYRRSENVPEIRIQQSIWALS